MSARWKRGVISQRCSDCVTALHCKAANGCLQYMTPVEYPFEGFVVLSRGQAEELLAMVDPIDGNRVDAANMLGLPEPDSHQIGSGEV